MSEIECAQQLHNELLGRRHSTLRSHGLFASAKRLFISDIRALAPECQKLKMVGLTNMAKCKATTGMAVKGLNTHGGEAKQQKDYVSMQ